MSVNPVREQELVHVEPIDDRSDQSEQGEQHRDVSLGGAGGRDATPVETQPTVEVVGYCHHQGGEDEKVEYPIGDGVQDWESEHVETNVQAEDRVGGAEFLGVEEQEDVVAPGRHRQPQQDRQTPGQPEPDLADPGLHPFPETLDQLFFFGQIKRRPAGRGAINDLEADPEDEERDGDAARPEQDRKAPPPLPYLFETDRVEPQVVGPQRAQGGQHQIDRSHRHQDQCEWPTTIRLEVRGNPGEHRP
jgi:hypothetical protein